MLTKKQVQSFLEAHRTPLDDAAAQALADAVNAADDCLTQHYDPGVADSIGLHLALLLTLGQQRTVTSERTPTGAARTYEDGAATRRWEGVAATIRMLDTAGCITLPQNPTRAERGGLWIGCCS